MSKLTLIAKLKNYTPKFLRRFIRANIQIDGYSEFANAQKNPFHKDPDLILFEDSPMKVGIIFSKTHYHKFWIAACRDLKVSYQIIYIDKHDWMEQVKGSGCDVYLSWPDISSPEMKQLHDERLSFMHHFMEAKLYPSLNEILFYENKRLQHYWLKQKGFKIPETKVFYNLEEAVLYLNQATYPLVFKSNLGASASGVYIVKSLDEALKKAQDFLRHGYKVKGSNGMNRQKGGLYVQAFLGAVKEWRMVRIGDSFFGHGKDMKGQFHSGSGKANWDLPSTKAFDLLYEITEAGLFLSMDVDMFEDTAGNFYINELQTVFGNSIAVEQLKKEGIPGRMTRIASGEYAFEPGSFCVNHLCNLRLQHLLSITNPD